MARWGMWGMEKKPELYAVPRIEITPAESINEAYSIVPEIEREIGGKVNVGVTRSQKGHYLVVAVSPTGKTKHTEDHLKKTVNKITEKHPELANYIEVTYKSVLEE